MEGGYLITFAVGFLLAGIIFGNLWLGERAKRIEAEKIILKLKKDLGSVLGWK
jgi:uncharacterized membrane protein YciS (DUF1049 family)